MIPVYYNPKQSVRVASFSPSASKPGLLVEDWKKNSSIKDQVVFHESQPIRIRSLYHAHSKSYVQGVIAGTEPNGFGTYDPVAANSFRYTVGSLITAVKETLTRKLPVGMSPTSGFHHAHYAGNHGFCTFNGLVLAAMYAQQHKLAKRILILDMDQHYGDGTEDILRKLKLKNIDHITSGKSYGNARSAFDCLDNIPFSVYDLVLYQAGADMHKDDPLGGIMTSNQLMVRDRFVFDECKRWNLPVVWNLAGGYQRDANGSIEPVLKIHRTTMQQCIEVFGCN